MIKLVATVSSVLVSLGLAAFLPAPAAARRPADPQGQGERRRRRRRASASPGGDLRKAYDLLRRLRADERCRGPTRGAAARLDRSRRRVLSRRAEGPDRRRHVPRPRVRDRRPRPGAGRRPRPQRLAIRPSRPRPAAAVGRLRPRRYPGAGPSRPRPRLRAAGMARHLASGPPTPRSISRRPATSITPRDATSRPAATSEPASSPVRRRQ